MEALLHPRVINLPHVVQQVYVQALLKVFGHAGRKKPSSSDSDSESESVAEPAEMEEESTREVHEETETIGAPEEPKEHEEKGR